MTTTAATDTITVTWSVEDAAIVHELLTRQIATLANWMTSDLLAGRVESATGHAQKREHLIQGTRAALRGAALEPWLLDRIDSR